MQSALNQYLNPQIPARIVSVGQKLVKITVRGRNIEAASEQVRPGQQHRTGRQTA